MPNYEAFNQGLQGLSEGVAGYTRAREILRERKRQEAQDALSKQFSDLKLSEGTPSVDTSGFMGLGSPMATRQEALELKGKMIIADKQARAERAKQEKADRNYMGQTSNSLRDEFNQLTKPFQTIGPMYKNIQSSAQNINPDAASDMKMIFSYMKILDPNSTVREGEYATAANSGTVPQSIQNAYNKMLSGEGILTPEQRKSFLSSAEGAFGTQAEQFKQHSERYKGLAGKMNIDPNLVVYDYLKDYLPPPGPPLQGPQEDIMARIQRIRGGK